MRLLRPSLAILCCLLVVACGGAGDESVEVWFLDASGRLASEERSVPSGDAGEQLTSVLDDLVAGPEDPALASILPVDTPLSGTLADGAASVDLGADFSAGFSAAGSSTAQQLVAPIVWTATGIDGVDSVLLLEGGAPLELTGSGLVFNEPLTRDDFPGADG